ncbi:ankyrin repeat domain-containing protein [Costertonia aggregata]|uniref:Ankyrin repeat domain-containing protein n=1 Tax=Costertonia aggregata TaxID=343403 RepID=A0A7H9ALJ9_9FLAO|nr:ankyrin repeat domain-containing protein [Costertonia aggregata]QLG44328.1 ankyrin repeat domain-containing protein [Costertonia aggregata]
MKKTILVLAGAFMLTATGVYAESATNNTDFETSITSKVDISSFCKAIMKGDIETVKKLIELGEDVNKKSLGMTPAIFAARYNKAEILELLIENGADTKIKCDKGYTAKKHAKISGAEDALSILEMQSKS